MAVVVLRHHVPPPLKEASVSVVSVPLTWAQSIFPIARRGVSGTQSWVSENKGPWE